MANYYRPKLQRHIIRVLWMVPIYAVDAFVIVCAVNPLMEVSDETRRPLTGSYWGGGGGGGGMQGVHSRPVGLHSVLRALLFVSCAAAPPRPARPRSACRSFCLRSVRCGSRTRSTPS